MTITQVTLLIAVLAVVAFGAMVVWQVRRRNLQLWLGEYLRQLARRRFAAVRRYRARNGGKVGEEPIHVLFCIADHFEPEWGGVSQATANDRVSRWVCDYEPALGGFRDSDGRPPRHTFFYPIDQYNAQHVDALAELCRDGFGEVEIHLHHDHDTAENLDQTLRRFTQLFAERHGLLGRWPDGRVAYGFVHGNWALDNSRPDGRFCGVCNELDVLQRTGCYADFTLPSAPAATQTRITNSIYYATGDPSRPKSHDRGVAVGMAAARADALMLIQGPLRPWWPRGSWTPRIENGCIQQGQLPTADRLDQWLKAHVHVESRPNWVFIKLHTHGAAEHNRKILLGEEMAGFHRELARRAALDKQFHFHYVTAREMYNLAKAAEAGWAGSIASALSMKIAPPRPDNSKSLVFGGAQTALSALSSTSDR